MPQLQKSHAGNSLGITGLLFGSAAIFTLFLFDGMLSILLGLIGVFLASAGIAQARENNGETGLIFSGLTVSIIGTAIALLWFFMTPDDFKNNLRHPNDRFTEQEEHERHIIIETDDWDYTADDLEEIAEEFEELGEELQEDLEEVLIDLESDLEDENIQVEIRFNDKEFHEIREFSGGILREILHGILNEIPDSISISVESE